MLELASIPTTAWPEFSMGSFKFLTDFETKRF
jgi:hypothetical protein